MAAVVNTWAHLAAVHDNAADTVSIYVNGVLRSTVDLHLRRGRPTAPPPWAARSGRRATSDYFSGAIDDVRLYDRVLTAGEIDDLIPA